MAHGLIRLPFAVLCVRRQVVFAGTGSHAGAILGMAPFLGLGIGLLPAVLRRALLVAVA